MEEVRKAFRPEFLNRLDEIGRLQPARARRRSGTSSTSSSDGSRSRLARRELHARGHATARRTFLAEVGLGPAVRRPPAQARHPEVPGGPARQAGPRRRVPAGHDDPSSTGAAGELTFSRQDAELSRGSGAGPRATWVRCGSRRTVAGLIGVSPVARQAGDS